MKRPTRVAKTAMIKFRVTEADLKRWRDAALVDDMPLSDWIRRRCDGRPTTQPVPKKVGR
jgi:hypothetical protein